jgi:uncharacterized protein YjbJ (UPF0337 family)
LNCRFIDSKGVRAARCYQELGGTSVSIQDRIEATAKNIEGKIQEAVGELTGDEKQKLEGKAKQMEAAAQHAKEDLKDAVKEGIDNLLG